MKHMSPQQLEENMGKWAAWVGQLSKQGQFKGGEPVADEGRQLTGKRKTVTDGPFGETKDIVGGYLLVTPPALTPPPSWPAAARSWRTTARSRCASCAR
jgi:hypothetical protein